MNLKDIPKFASRLLFFRGLLKLCMRFVMFLWYQTISLRHYNYPQILFEQTAIYVIYHDNLLVIAFILKPENRLHKRQLNVLASAHPDGQLLIELCQTYGRPQVVSGSSTRGGAMAVKQLIEYAKRGETVLITPDGPRGPVGEVKKGVLYVAMKSGAPIIPIGISLSHYRRLRTWDRMKFPKINIFAKGHVYWGDPIFVADKSDEKTLEKIRQELEKTLHDCGDKAREKRDNYDPKTYVNSRVDNRVKAGKSD